MGAKHSAAHGGAALTAEPLLLAPIFARFGGRCGRTYDWDAAITERGDSVETLSGAEQDHFRLAIRDLLDAGAGAEQVAEMGCRDFGVTAIFLEDGSRTAHRVRAAASGTGGASPTAIQK